MRNLIILNAAALLWSAWRRRYLIAIPIVVVPMLALLVGFISPKKYTSYTTVLIEEAAKQNPFLEDFTVATNLKGRMEALNALLHSRHILASVASKQGMINDDTSAEEREAVISKLSRSLTAQLVGEDLIKVSLVSNSPDGMRELLWAVTSRYIERVIAPQRSAITKSEDFLVEEIDKRQKNLLDTEQKLAGYKSRFASELPNLHASNVNRLSQVREVLAERKITLDGAQAARDSLRKRLSRTNPVVGRVEEAIVQGLSDLAVLRARYTDKHTLVQAAVRKLRSLEKERAKALQTVKELTSEDLERLWNRASTQTSPIEKMVQPLLVSQLQNLQESESTVNGLLVEVVGLENELNDLERSVTAFGEHDRRLKEFDREITVKRKTFDELVERYEKAQVMGALGRSEERERVKIIDPPFTPEWPTNPSLLLFFVAGVFGGLMLGIGLAVAVELLDTTLWRRDSLATLVGVPVLTRIPVLHNEGFAFDGNGLDQSFFDYGKPEGKAHA
jgi:polysaccharide chain length determinant protein (PEP-CTERM system associated)